MVFEIPKFIGTAKIILFVISILITSLSIQIGSLLSYIFSEELTKWIGAGFLMLMGLWIIYQALSTKKDNLSVLDASPTMYQFMIRFLGITIQIIRNPIFSDLDHSKKIDWKEAIFLGVCLSIDSICIGICSSMIGGPSYLFPILVAAFQLLFLSIGRMLGEKLSCVLQIPENIWSILSGILLICIGTSRFFI
ncbi:MAG: hypothetical protein HFJ27_01000 [Clostridia bacterium]|nr:hypothetical protein [Clostridia bacterium]